MSEFYTVTVEHGDQKASVQLTKEAVLDEQTVGRIMTARLLPKIGVFDKVEPPPEWIPGWLR